MTELEMQTEEFAELIKRADTATKEWAEQEKEFLELFRKLSPEEQEAYIQNLKDEVATNE